ncbi:hypothetical protein PR202_ga18834 [Eleusine coracana subsp. coracana]|uniref:SAM domain-containing protein n=1 Tax=Eleusine coracana subsp. coracana TaxID=191504 RepID=A0AAV5CSE7_ELECO|nr:hypothetical protein QOZ80_4AG0301930 [Eleusine coracana subsp. coracana]GJN01559.1 hypothetical protein PR202_ga18834 [Eleusine coracana subsp. coracana]
MDWHAWLSAARLDPALVYEYAQVFARNELEADDVAYLDHDLLHSMGVSVAKHRLEILKLAWRHRLRRPSLSLISSSSSSSFPNKNNKPRRLLGRVARYVRALVRRDDDSSSSSSTALVLVPSHLHHQQQQLHDEDSVSNTKRRRGKALRRARSEPKGSTTPARAAAVHAVSRDLDNGAGEEMMLRWDSLFHQDLKPN